MIRLSLRQRLMLLAAVAVLPAIVIVLFNEVSSRNSRLAEAEAYALRMSEIVHGEVLRALTGAGTILVALGEAPVVHRRLAEDCANYVAAIREALPPLLEIAVSDANGNTFCRSGSMPGGAVAALGRDLMSNLGEGEFVVGEFHRTETGGMLPIGRVQRDADGAVESFVFMGISVEALKGVVLGDRFGVDSAVYVTDRRGVVLVHSSDSAGTLGASIAGPYAALLNERDRGTTWIADPSGEQRIVGYQPVAEPLNIAAFVGLSERAIMAPINRATLQGSAIALAGAVLAFLLAWGIGQAFVRAPVTNIARTIASWRAGERSARTHAAQDASELGAIAAAIDDLFDELDRRETAQKRAEAQRDVYAGEVQHRIKNLMAVVQGIAKQTLRGKKDVPEVQTFQDRISVLISAHMALLSQDYSETRIDRVAQASVNPFVGPASDRVSYSGPELHLAPKVSLALSLALHELATNAMKHGALSRREGVVEVDWKAEDGEFELRWRESGGPAVQPPGRSGFGSMLIGRALEAETWGKVQIDFAEQGLSFVLRAPLDHIRFEPPEAKEAASEAA